jgi:long-subunit fatty acid transport protein
LNLQNANNSPEEEDNMKHIALFAAALAAGTTGATAGGVDRSGQSISPLFEEGNYLELSYGHVNPTVSGTIGGGTVSSGDVGDSYSQTAAAFKYNISDTLSFAIIMDKPFGANVDYGNADAAYPYLNSTARIHTAAFNAILRYKISERIGVHAGLRRISASGEVSTPATGYTLETSTETDTGYLIGASYEIPDIALRASITYNSTIDVDFTTLEASVVPGEMEVALPQSINLDFQTGIAADTLLFTSLRWVDWSEFNISPSLAPDLVDFDSDTITYALGVGHRFNDKISGSATLGYEASSGDPVGDLGPTDGQTSIALGARYKLTETTAIAGGVSYIWIGDATTNSIAADFSGNSAVAFGLKLSHTF